MLLPLPELFLDLPETGIYYLKVYATCGEGGAGCQGPYILSIDSDYEYEPNNSMEQATIIECDDMLQATLNGYEGVMFWEDEDFYRFSCDADSIVNIKVEAAPYPDSDLLPLLCLLDNSGVEITCDEDGILTSQIESEILEDQDYILRVNAICGEGGINCRGPYTLELSREMMQNRLYLPTMIQ